MRVATIDDAERHSTRQAKKRCLGPIRARGRSASAGHETRDQRGPALGYDRDLPARSTTTGRMRTSRSIPLLLSCFLAALLPACGGALPSDGYPHQKEYDPRKNEYVIGVADELRVTVWKMPDLTDDVVVRPDGTITLPLIMELRALNKTPTRLAEEIRQKLLAYVKEEQAIVSVEVKQINSYRFVVSGNVTRPGPLTSRYFVTISEALIMAGGPTRFGAPERTVILRADGSGKIRRIPVDAKALAEGKKLEQDLAVVAGDTIVVP